MSQGPAVTERLDSWKQIAAYLGRTVRTVIRWEQEGGLPVHRVPVGQRHCVFAYTSEIDEWLRSGRSVAVGEDGDVNEPDLDHPERQSASHVAIGLENQEIWADGERTSIASRAQSKLIVAAGAAIVLVAALIFVFAELISPRTFLFAGETQITNDGAVKTGLVTDGVNLYFGEWREGRIVISTVAVQGGRVHEIPTPFIQAEPLAIDADGRHLLVLAGQGQEQERALWILPVQGGTPRRVGAVMCHSAAWSPNSQRIAFASGSSIYLTSNDGLPQQLLQTFAAIPEDLRWSQDGRRLLFRLRNMNTWASALWEIVLSGDHNTPASLFPLSVASNDYQTVSPIIDDRDDAFVGTEGNNAAISSLERSRWPGGARFELKKFAQELSPVSSFAVDSRKQQLYLLKDSPGQNELDRFDSNSHDFRPFLPGISARDVNFSRDGRWIAYVRIPNDSLWVAASDGSSARQIATSGMTGIELPRWSPDGSELAFMGRRANAPYRIFVTSAAGGPLHEASRGTDNQGAPTWSPDGTHLVYGRVMCQEDKTCAIGEIDLRTGQQSVVQGSEGLSTARWSPDGRYIAALRADRCQVFLLDRRTGKWRKLADGVNGNDLGWAPNSRAVYASKPGGDKPEVIRISLLDGKAEPAVDLTSFSKLQGRVDTWFAVTPNDSILFLHLANGSEVYSIHYVVK